ncbi:MAG TPA: hypothetical protein VIH90_06255 [Candidatus Saccharimonadales bacterium]
MTKSSKRVGYHALFVAIVIGIALSISLIKLYTLKNNAAKMVVGDALSERLINVHPTANGLMEVNIIKNPDIIIVNNSKNIYPVIIPSSIGIDALNTDLAK